MAQWVVDPSYSRSVLDRLDSDMQNKIRKKMVENAAKVLVKEMQDATESHHHVLHGWMKNSIAAGPVYQDIDQTTIEVYPQGVDPRGVINEGKMKKINYGYWRSSTNTWVKKKDHFLNDAFRKKCEPRINSVMNYTLQLCMEELENS